MILTIEKNMQKKVELKDMILYFVVTSQRIIIFEEEVK
jgi:hypothetical protein